MKLPMCGLVGVRGFVMLKKIESSLKIRFPRTARGWRTLFWLTLGRCPIHHKKLVRNWPYDNSYYGLCCDGWSICPVTGFVANLRGNYEAYQESERVKQQKQADGDV